MDQTVSRSFAGDVAVSTPSFGAGGSGLSPRLAGAVRSCPRWTRRSGLGRGVAEVDGKGRALTVTDPVALERTFDLGTVAGLPARPRHRRHRRLTETEADKQRLARRRRGPVAFTDGASRPSRRRRSTAARLAGDYVITRAAWAPHRTQDSDTLVAVASRTA